jgi:hypothetical protein
MLIFTDLFHIRPIIPSLFLNIYTLFSDKIRFYRIYMLLYSIFILRHKLVNQRYIPAFYFSFILFLFLFYYFQTSKILKNFYSFFYLQTFSAKKKSKPLGFALAVSI